MKSGFRPFFCHIWSDTLGEQIGSGGKSFRTKLPIRYDPVPRDAKKVFVFTSHFVPSWLIKKKLFILVSFSFYVY